MPCRPARPPALWFLGKKWWQSTRTMRLPVNAQSQQRKRLPPRPPNLPPKLPLLPANFQVSGTCDPQVGSIYLKDLLYPVGWVTAVTKQDSCSGAHILRKLG